MILILKPLWIIWRKFTLNVNKDGYMDVGICGFGYTGSGAVNDLLKEYKNVNFSTGEEFFITYFPDGLNDLKRGLCETRSKFFNSDVSVCRFLSFCRNYGSLFNWNSSKCNDFFDLSKTFVDNLMLKKWMGDWAYDYMYMSGFSRFFYYSLGNRINKLFDRTFIKHERTMYLGTDESTFNIEANKYVESIKKLMGYNNDCYINVFNQPFAANNPEESFKFFSNPYAIITVRDPRDVYIMVKHFVKNEAKWLPVKDVDVFISFVRNQYVNLMSRSRVLVIHFEDLVYKYEETVKEIERFLLLDIDNKQKKKYFDPAKSVNNTRLFEKIHLYDSDIRKIENELGDLLYPFDDVEKIDNNGCCFWD